MNSTACLRRVLTACAAGCAILLATPPAAQAAGLLVADGGFGGKLEIEEQEVHVTINNGIAVTTVDQIFVNTENRIVEALYTFPVPKGASVSNFSMIIGGKEMIGEVVEKKRARQIYESYKTTRRDPGLLEQVDFKTFELRVFPIAAGAQQRLSITYAQQLDFDHNSATYVYPLATTTRGAIDTRTTGKFALTLDVKSEIPMVQLRSPSHVDDFAITSHTPHYTRASLELPAGDLSRDVVISYDTQRPHTGIDIVTSKQSGQAGYFMLSMTAGKELQELESGMDYVFVLDISGSMANEGKLSLSRSAIEGFVDALGPEDRFEVMTFNTQPILLFQSLSDVGEESKGAAKDFLLDQRARGGTVLRPAVTTAYKYKAPDRPLNVVILSDGLTEVREQAELLASINGAPSGTRVFCIGVGNDTNRPLLKQLADSAGGLAAFISHEDDFRRQAEAFRRKLMRPVATNVSIEVDGAGVRDLAQEGLPDLYFGSPVWMLGRYTQAGTAKVIVSAEVLGQPFREEVTLEFPELDDRNPEIERMWAYQRMQTLMDRMRATQADPQTIEEIIRLCEGYSIVSEYASFIVLENEAEYQRWSIQRRNLNRFSRDRTARERLVAELDRLREDSLSRLGPAEAKLVSTATTTEQPPQRDQTVQASNPAADRAAGAPQASTPGDISFLPSPGGASGGAGGGGGGAIDPISGMILCNVVGAAVWAARRRRQPPEEITDRGDVSDRTV